MSQKVSREILDAFLDEAIQYLPSIRKGPCDFLADENGFESLEESFRLIHIIKGAASMVGLTELSHEADAIESALESLVYGERQRGPSDIEGAIHLLEGIDSIERKLAELAASAAAFEPPAQSVNGNSADAFVNTSHTMTEAVHLPTADVPADTVQNSDTSIDQEMLEVYAAEAEEHLHTITTGLAGLEHDPSNRTALQNVRRSVHTLKGAAAVVGFKTIASLAHRMEDLLDRLYEKEHPIPPDALSILFGGIRILENLSHGAAEDSLRGAIDDILTRLEQVLTGLTEAPTPLQSAPAEAPQPSEAPLLSPEAAPQEHFADIAFDIAPEDGADDAALQRAQARVVRVPLPRLDALSKLVSEMVINRSVMEQRIRDLEEEVADLVHSSGRLRNLAGRIEKDRAADTFGAMRGSPHTDGQPWTTAGRTSTQAHAAPYGFDALEFDRYTAFDQWTRELMEVTSDTGAMADEVEIFLGDFEAALRRQRRLTNEIQDCLMGVRMLPIRVLAPRLHRAVRVAADQERKQAVLVIDGETTEMDTTVIEHIADPLLHLLRNAVGHGIEPSEQRRACGKPEQGTIRMSAFHEGTHIVIQVTDDGAGLDVNAIRDKAAGMGLISRAQADVMSPPDAYRLILAPGLSTAKGVSELSGRGVGLDAVREVVQRLHGSVTIDSNAGKWTTFTLRLPMTLTVTGSVLVQISGTTYALPLDSVEQIVRLDAEQSRRFAEERELRMDGAVYPLVRMSQALQLPSTEESTTGPLPVLLMHLGSGRAAAIVDRVIGGREIVVKPLGTHLKRVRGILGATMLGDGTVIPILNPADLGDTHAAFGAASTDQAAVNPPTGANAARVLSIMIVDDSPTVRRINAALVRSSGWLPITAKDGLDALEHLRQSAKPPDVILLDIEMPRMDGYELLANLRAQEAYRYVPVIMITSRMSEKHRKKAMDLGVSEYLTKPYTDDVLLGHIRRLAL